MAHRGKKTKDGFRSKFEQAVSRALTTLKIKFTYETEKLPYILEKKYTGDFFVDDIILEVKGVLLGPDIEKMLAVKKAYPNRRIVFVFMYPNKKVPRHKATHAEWAEKNGFEWLSIDTLKELK